MKGMGGMGSGGSSKASTSVKITTKKLSMSNMGSNMGSSKKKGMTLVVPEHDMMEMAIKDGVHGAGMLKMIKKKMGKGMMM